jgi:hypothetical protein
MVSQKGILLFSYNPSLTLPLNNKGRVQIIVIKNITPLPLTLKGRGWGKGSEAQKSKKQYF